MLKAFIIFFIEKIYFIQSGESNYIFLMRVVASHRHVICKGNRRKIPA